MDSKKGEVSFGAIVSTIGSILIALGVAWMIAINWSSIPSALKIFILVLATAGAFFAGVALKVNEYPKIGGSLLILGSLLYTLSIFLIAQIFSTRASMQGLAILLLLAWVGVLAAAYLFDSSPSLLIALSEFLIWIGFQFVAFFENSIGEPAIGVLALTYLMTGILLFGLMQLHKSFEHKFAGVYQFWTMVYLLLLTYIMSFQLLLPILWPENFVMNIPMLFFVLSFALVSIIVAGIGISMSLSSKKISGNEILFAIIAVLVYALLIVLSSLVSGSPYGMFGYGNTSPGLLVLWILDNVLFIGVILAVIGYGVKSKKSSLVNLGILFFVLEIITRYIGFIMDLGGQMGFAVVSIIGGLILIFGGWSIEKWRKNLLAKTKA
jgi:uncharacterized membrane protein